jgi:hypothetical protein
VPIEEIVFFVIWLGKQLLTAALGGYDVVAPESDRAVNRRERLDDSAF